MRFRSVTLGSEVTVHCCGCLATCVHPQEEPKERKATLCQTVTPPRGLFLDDATGL